MMLSVDWSVLDAKLPPYTKQIKCAPRLTEFRYSVEEGAGSPGLDLEESLLSDGCGDDMAKSSANRINVNNFCVNGPISVSPSYMSSVSSSGVSSGVKGWTGNKNDVADKLLCMFSTSEHLSDEDTDATCDEDTADSPLGRMLVGAGVSAKMRTDESLTHMDAEIVIELFTENQSITLFIEEMSKFDVPRIVSSKIYMYLKTIISHILS